jgi:DNA integrity scanning protein DisA with diadenylate cyclase activity
MYEYALFVANLSAIDGAVVLTEGPELIGYGAVIQGALDTGTQVARALDPEAETIELESIEAVGTRHRSAYHLCSRVRDVLATVVSQDGNVRIVTWKKGMVTYWEVIPITLAGLDSFEQ